MIERLVKKEDLQNHFKADLIDEVMLNELVNEETKELYSWEELIELNCDDLVDLIVDSKKIYIVEE